VRTALTVEMWDAINGTWLELKRFGNGPTSREEFMRFLRWVQESSLRFDGSAYRTMLRNDAYWFSRLGVYIERADNTARILDVKYHVLREFTAGQFKIRSTGQDFYREDIAASVHATEASMDQAARLIRGARRVALVGVGASFGIAAVAMDILFTLGKQALPIETEQTASFAFSPPVAGLALLAISHSGETRFPIQVAERAREAGLQSIGITNEPASELARAVDILLPTQAVEPPRGSYAIAPRICQLAVLDQLFSRASG